MQKLTQWRLRLAKTLYREFQHLWEFGRNIPLAFRNGCDDHRRRSALLTGYPVELLESDGKYRGACVRYRLPDTCYYPVSCLQWKTFVLIEMASIRMILEQIANILTCFLSHFGDLEKFHLTKSHGNFTHLARKVIMGLLRNGNPQKVGCPQNGIRKPWVLFRHERTEFKKTGNKRASLVRKRIRWNDEMSTIQYDFTILPATIAVKLT